MKDSIQLLPTISTAAATILCYCIVFLSTNTQPTIVHSFVSRPSIPTTQQGRRVPGVGQSLYQCTSPHPSYCISSYSTSSSSLLRSTDQDQGTLLSPPTTPTQTATIERISIQRPRIHWAVPIQNIGWRDAESNTWYDNDGPRKGPPQNFWRQRIDQRAYSIDMNIVTQLLTTVTDGGAVVDPDLEEAIREVEYCNSARRPSLDRKLLGTWAPLYLDGCKVAHVPSSEPVPFANMKVVGEKPIDFSAGPAIEVPLTITIARTAGRNFAEKNRYGLFDAKLVEGEEITVRTSDGAVDVTLESSEANEPVVLGAMNVEDSGGNSRLLELRYGSVTYVSDYLVLQRDEEGVVSDMWLRLDTAYLGKNSAE